MSRIYGKDDFCNPRPSVYSQYIGLDLPIRQVVTNANGRGKVGKLDQWLNWTSALVAKLCNTER